jgi:quinol monooxygenase YgiN
VRARLARYSVEPDRIDAAVESFREAGAEIAQLDGYRGGHLLVDYDEGTLLTITLWENQDALDRSEVRAASLRQVALRVVEGEVQSVTRYTVPFELG